MIEISSWTDLNNIRNNLSGDYVLTRSLKTSDEDYANIGNDWKPIGSPPNNPFTGTFDGRGYTINGLIIKVNTDYAGLFSYITGKISNVGIINVDIDTGNYYPGSLAGVNVGTINNSYATGNVNGSYGAGGLVGDNTGIITKSLFIGNVNGWRAVGGLVGPNYGSITDCYSTGNVSGELFVGGLVGDNTGYWGPKGQVYGTIINSYATGNVSGRIAVGGFAGGGGVNKNCGWYNHAGNPDSAMGSGGWDITYTETDNTVFYSKTHGVYNGNPSWDFVNIWEEKANDYPKLRFLPLPEPPTSKLIPILLLMGIPLLLIMLSKKKVL